MGHNRTHKVLQCLGSIKLGHSVYLSRVPWFLEPWLWLFWVTYLAHFGMLMGLH